MSKEYITDKEELNQEVSELVAEYIVQKPARNARVSDFRDLLADKLLMSSLIRKGIPYSMFHSIQRISPFSDNEWAGFLNISTKSLQRFKDERRHLKPIHSEKIFEMAEVTELGMKIFEDMDKFKLWLDTPNFALGHYKPKELITDSYGKELVVGELTRINYGIFV